MTNFETNPFIPSFDHEIVGDHRIEHFKSLITNLNRNKVSNPNNQARCEFFIVKAQYGNGKTFFSFKLEEKFKNENDILLCPFVPYQDGAGQTPFKQKGFQNIFFKKLLTECEPKLSNRIKTELKSLIDQPSDDGSNFVTLLKSLYDDGSVHLIFVLDEIEAITSSRAGFSFFSNLKDLYDKVVKETSFSKEVCSISFVLLISEQSYEEIDQKSRRGAAGSNILTPFLERVTETFSLQEFDLRDTSDLIKVFLKKAKSDHDSTEPFDQQVIEGIYKITRGIPRRILKHCRQLFNLYLEVQPESITYDQFKEYCEKSADIVIPDDSIFETDDPFDDENF